MIELEPKTWPRCRDGATRRTLDSLVAFRAGFCQAYDAIRLRFDGVPASRDAGMMRLWSYRGMPKAEVWGQGDGAMYGLPNRLRALLPDPTTGEHRWESAGRDLINGDETEIRTVAVINSAHLRRLGGRELTQSERLPEPHGDGGSADWPGDQTLRARLVDLNWAVNAAYYLFWFFIAKAIIVAVWLVKDEEVRDAVAADASVRGKGVTAVKDLLAGVAAGLVRGCKDLAAAGRRYETLDALVTYVKHEHVAICRAESELAGGEGLEPLKHAEGLGDGLVLGGVEGGEGDLGVALARGELAAEAVLDLDRVAAHVGAELVVDDERAAHVHALELGGRRVDRHREREAREQQLDDALVLPRLDARVLRHEQPDRLDRGRVVGVDRGLGLGRCGLALRVAERRSAANVAAPLIGAGARGTPLDEAARAAARALANWRAAEPGLAPRRLAFGVQHDFAAAALEAALGAEPALQPG